MDYSHYLPYFILGIFALIFILMIGFLGLAVTKKIFGKRKTGEYTLESGDVDIVEKPGWFLYFRRRIAFYWNEFWYDRWLRVIRLREDRRMDFKNCLVSDKTVEFEDKTKYIIDAKRVVRYQGKSYYFIVQGKGDFNAFESSDVLSDKEFYAKYNSARARELYLMTQAPLIQYLIYMGIIIIGLLVILVVTDMGMISSVESAKLDALLETSGAMP